MSALPTYLVTGGAGFIGSHFVHAAINHARVVTLDALTYAGQRVNLAAIADHPNHTFIHGDIGDAALVTSLLATHRASAIIHFAAESHVDRSIQDASAFLQTNVLGTHNLLACATQYLAAHPNPAFRFINVSTDEVFGSLGPSDAPFSETSQYRPNSPYAASKAAADHLARAFFVTHGLPVITTHCSNNYGPRQFPEKLIPLVITNALAGRSLPVYGDGQNVRDWLHVSDHVQALQFLLDHGLPGETYAIGGHAEKTTLDIVHAIAAALDLQQPAAASYAELIAFVPDRPGHDRRYAIDDQKLQALGWRPTQSFDAGLSDTVAWYLAHPEWVDNARARARAWFAAHYRGLA